MPVTPQHLSHGIARRGTGAYAELCSDGTLGVVLPWLIRFR